MRARGLKVISQFTTLVAGSTGVVEIKKFEAKFEELSCGKFLPLADVKL